MCNRRKRSEGRRPLAVSAAALLVLLSALPAAAQLSSGAIPAFAIWKISPAFGDREEASSLSGLACARIDGAGGPCLLVNDEKRYARLVTLKEQTIVLGAKLTLLPRQEEDGTKLDEADAEAADFNGGFYYVIGSHARSRKGGQAQPSRSFVYRWPIDPASGQPKFKPDGEKPAKEVERSDRLRTLIAETAPFNEFLRRPADAHDPNIEGLAVRDGRLHAGFRAPSVHGEALVLSVPVDALFGKEKGTAVVARVRLGEGRGIRDLAKVKDGFLILSGPEADINGKAEVLLWDGRSPAPLSLGRLADAAIDGKPEALLVLDEAPDRFRVLVLCDGVKGGAPTEYRLPRPRP